MRQECARISRPDCRTWQIELVTFVSTAWRRPRTARWQGRAPSGSAGCCERHSPAVIVQTDAFPPTHASVLICQMTTEIVEAADFRVTLDPSKVNGLRVRSQVMADKPVTVRRARVGPAIGRLDADDLRRLNVALAFVMGLADTRV